MKNNLFLGYGGVPQNLMRTGFIRTLNKYSNGLGGENTLFLCCCHYFFSLFISILIELLAMKDKPIPS